MIIGNPMMMGGTREIDVNFAPYCKLALRMNGPNGGTTFTDLSPIGRSMTVNGNVQTSTAQYKWADYGSSGSFDNNGDYLEAASTADLNPAGDFTFRMWLYPTLLSGIKSVFAKWGPGTNYAYLCYLIGGNFTFMMGNGNSSHETVIGGSNLGLVPNTWQHLEIGLSGSTLYVFRDGVQKASGTRTLTPGGMRPLEIGASTQVGSGSADGFGGYIQDFQFYNGVCLHATSFAPPTGPFLTGS